MSARSGTNELEVIRQKAMMDEVVRKAGKRAESRELQLERENASLREQLRLTNDKMAECARRVEQEQAEKIRALEEERDVAVIKAAHLEKRLEVAHESITFAHDKMAERERQARWEVADEAINRGRGADAYLWEVRDANAPKD